MSGSKIKPLPVVLSRDPVDWQAKETLGVPLRSNFLARREAERQLYRMAAALFWFLAGSICTVIAVLLMR